MLDLFLSLDSVLKVITCFQEKEIHQIIFDPMFFLIFQCITSVVNGQNMSFDD